MSSNAKRQASGSRLAAKSLKRASSGSKKKGLGATPDAESSHSSTSSTGQDKRQEECFLDEVLRGEDIDALRIREENLKTVPRPPSSERPRHTRKVVVKKPHSIAGGDVPQPKHNKVAVLHPLPRGTAMGATRPLGNTEVGPRFDKQGTFLPHSVLGPTHDYASQLKDTAAVGEFSANPPIVKPEEVSSPREKTMSYAKTIVPRERHALKYWNKSMEMRKSQQKYLATKIGSPPEKLAMNQADGFRATQEQRALIDKAMPSVDYGKGYRVGSEFWNQRVRIGNDVTGINTTLTQSEQGLPPEFEFVGVPSMIRKEKGMPMADQERNAPIHYTWEQSSYLASRKKELADILDTVEPFRPEMSELQVIGHQPGSVVDHVGEGGPSRARLRTDSLDSLGETDSLSSGDHDSEGDMEQGSLLDLGPDVGSQPIIGPALRVGGHLLKWLGPPPSSSSTTSGGDQPASKLSLQGRATQSESALNLASVAQLTSTASLMHLPSPVASQLQLHFQQEYLNKQPIQLRINFEGKPNAVVSSFLEMENCGTAAVYFSWQLLPQSNPLQTIQAGSTQRFYFDSKGGVLLPGQRLEFPFVFKSPIAGIFSETWSLQTGPVLNRGRPITITLKGVAFQEDLGVNKRQQLEELLTHRMAEAAAQRIVNRLVNSIQTPPRSPELITTTVLEEDIFRTKNPGVYYRHNTVQQLKTLHLSVVCPELVPEPEPAQEPVVKSGKKGDEKSAGKGKEKGGKEKDKKPPAQQKAREEPTEVPQSATDEARQTTDVPEWDLSIASLQDAIMDIENTESRESKLKQLNCLVGALSFPPPPPRSKPSNYNICYETLSEAIDKMTDISVNLCHVLHLPQREYLQGGGANGKVTDYDDSQSPGLPASPAPGKAAKKGAGKDGKKTEMKKTSAKEKDKGGGSKVKPAKSKSQVSPKEAQQLVESHSSTPASGEADPVAERKYRDNFHATVFEVLGAAVERMASLFNTAADNV